MLRNYLVVAIRNLLKHPLYSAITIGGLAVGLAACLMILLFVRDELSYDQWIPNADRIAKLEDTVKIPGREPMSFGLSPGLAKAALEKDFSSEIERVVRICNSAEPIRVGDKVFSGEIAYVDPGFFAVFDLPMARGQRDEVLDNNTSLLLSERMAEKYFGDAPAIGQVLTVDNKVDYKVVGVFKELPHNTHLELDFIALLDPQRYVEQPWVLDRWTSVNVHTYILFRSPSAFERVAADLPAFVDRNVIFEVPGFEKSKISDVFIFHLMPLLDIHLHGHQPGDFKEGGDIATVITFSAIAALILLIACINFINLATARSMQRAREVAMRKVVGATRRQLIGQFLGEAGLTALIAALLAVAAVEVVIGPYSRFLDKQLSLDFVGDPLLLVVLLGLVGFVGLLGGAYPAIYLSRFRPARVLKANQSAASGGTLLRNTLVVFQFAVSIGLIIATSVVYAQNRYARGLDLGFRSANRLVLAGLSNIPDGAAKVVTLKNELAALPQVTRASLSSDTPPLSNNNNTLLYRTPTPNEDKFVVESLAVDYDFFAVYGVEPRAGRLFSRDFATDARSTPEDKSVAATQSIVVNQTFLDKLGIASPEQAVGVVLWDLADPDQMDQLVRTTVVGVVSDMHLRSIDFDTTPLLYYLRPEESGEFNGLSLDVAPGQMSATLAAAERIWASIAPEAPMRPRFVDQEIAAQYDAIGKRGKMFGGFAIFAVLIACLGLFGLASFAAERRTKEIGMRKALGASALDIVRLLMWQFSKPVLIANVIAWPVAFYAMNRWLATFKYHIDFSAPRLLLTVFGGAGLIAMVIAWATVAGQTARVARASPVHALRFE